MTRWDWTEADLDKALAAARKGKGAQLAKLIKATSQEDLAAGLSHNPGYLPGALYFCLGRKQFRREFRREMRGWRRASPLLANAEIRFVGSGKTEGSGDD